MLNKLSNKTIILLLILDVIISAGVVVLYFFELFSETVFIILLFILLMLFSSLLSGLMQRKMLKKMQDKKKGKEYHYENELTFNNPLKEFKTNYGKIELYIENKVLYSLIMIEDTKVFFSDEQQEIKYNIDKKKYDKAIQFYLFINPNNEYFRKITIFNYQAQKFYVASFIVNDSLKTLYQSDFVKPNEEYKSIYDNFFELLKIKTQI